MTILSMLQIASPIPFSGERDDGYGFRYGIGKRVADACRIAQRIAGVPCGASGRRGLAVVATVARAISEADDQPRGRTVAARQHGGPPRRACRTRHARGAVADRLQ